MAYSDTLKPSIASSSSSPNRTINTRSVDTKMTTLDPKSSSTSTRTPKNRSMNSSPSFSPSSPRTTYLLIYNSISALAWAIILFMTVRYIFYSAFSHFFLLRQQGPPYPNIDNNNYDDDDGTGKTRDPNEYIDIDSAFQSETGDAFPALDLYGAAGALTRWTQTAAVLEIVHAMLGLVRASPLTTAIQVSSRLLLVWGIVYQFPTLAYTIAYPSMLLAWSITEVVRYTYFAVLLNRTRILDKNSSRTSNSNNSRISGGGSSSSSEKNPAILDDQPPPWLTWSRYNLFFVLYPLGILSEMRLIYLAIEPASQAFSAAADHDESKYKERVGWFLWAILAVYVPGSYVMITHMMAQRRRVKRGKAKSRTV